MNREYIEQLQNNLKWRVDRLMAVDYRLFHGTVRQFCGFLKANDAFAGVLEELQRRFPAAGVDVQKVTQGGECVVFDNEMEHAAFAHDVIKLCANSQNSRVELDAGKAYHLPVSAEKESEAALKGFCSAFVQPLSQYLIEQLDEQRIMLTLLRRYKHKCEWFQRDALLNLWKSDTVRGEWNLKLHLFQYLHDQGLDFTIEPYSQSGKADLIAGQSTGDPLIADAKLFNLKKGKDYVVRGYRQLYQYTLDFNEPAGYMVIFKTCQEELRFALTNQTHSTPFVINNNKTVYFLTIDICDYQKPA